MARKIASIYSNLIQCVANAGSVEVKTGRNAKGALIPSKLHGNHSHSVKVSKYLLRSLRYQGKAKFACAGLTGRTSCDVMVMAIALRVHDFCAVGQAC